MKDEKLMGALRRCMDAEVCETDCPGYAYCIAGGGNIMVAAAEHLAEAIQKKRAAGASNRRIQTDECILCSGRIDHENDGHAARGGIGGIPRAG